LGSKLLQISKALGLSQNELIRFFGFQELVQGTISAYESGNREPSLLVLLAYARAANVAVEALIDDDLDLPEKLPAHPKSEGIRIKSLKKSTAGIRRQRS
jgi:transcriptional regulator with XRE-family HTH domain